MLTKYFILFTVYLLRSFLGIFSIFVPGFQGTSIIYDCLSALLGVTDQISNFIYFLFGDFYYTALVLVALILPLKYLIVPVLSFIRKIFVWGGNQALIERCEGFARDERSEYKIVTRYIMFTKFKAEKNTQKRTKKIYSK